MLCLQQRGYKYYFKKYKKSFLANIYIICDFIYLASISNSKNGCLFFYLLKMQACYFKKNLRTKFADKSEFFLNQNKNQNFLKSELKLADVRKKLRTVRKKFADNPQLCKYSPQVNFPC